MAAGYRAALHNAPSRRSDYSLPGRPGYDAFIRECNAWDAEYRAQWLRDREIQPGRFMRVALAIMGKRAA